MKVLFVAPADSVHTVRWIERVQSLGIECVLFDMTSKELQQPINIANIYRAKTDNLISSISRGIDKLGIVGLVFSPILKTINDYQSLKVIIKEHDPDLINIHWLFHHAALAASLFKRVPKVATPWGSDLLVPEYKGVKHLINRLRNRLVVAHVVRSADELCCDAVHMKSLLVGLGAKEECVNLIYFGTDTNIFSPHKRDKAYWEKFGIANDELVVLSNRVLANMYNIETLLESAAMLRNSILKLRFVIAGSGPDVLVLKSKVSELGIEDITIFTGRLNDEDFVKATASSDIYVSTSPTDGGIAASVAEAMSCEVPVIITNFGDNEFWLKGQTAGLLFNSGDQKQLANHITKMAESLSLREQMGKKGRAIILSDNNSTLELAKIKSLYQRVASKRIR